MEGEVSELVADDRESREEVEVGARDKLNPGVQIVSEERGGVRILVLVGEDDVGVSVDIVTRVPGAGARHGVSRIPRMNEVVVAARRGDEREGRADRGGVAGIRSDLERDLSDVTHLERGESGDLGGGRESGGAEASRGGIGVDIALRQGNPAADPNASVGRGDIPILQDVAGVIVVRNLGVPSPRARSVGQENKRGVRCPEGIGIGRGGRCGGGQKNRKGQAHGADKQSMPAIGVKTI